jgi:membrane protein
VFQTFRIPLTWRELATRTYNDANQDNALGLAAELSYYFLLSLVPTIVCLVALASFLPPQTIQEMIESLRRFAPGEVTTIVRDQLTALANRSNQGIFTFGLLFALWSSSAAMVSLSSALNRAYDIEEARPWWKVRLTAIFLTIGVAVFVVLAFGLVIVGPTLADQLAQRMGLGAAFTTSWKILQWPFAFALVTVGLGLIYYFGPDAEQDWEWVTPGAVFGTALWLLASLAFKIYVTRFGTYNETYGSLGGVIVTMLWFYLSALAIVIGAEMNAEIEHASPHGKEPGEKVPGQKKKIGAAAAREFAERQRQGKIPSFAPAVAQPSPGDLASRPSWSAYLVLSIGLWRAMRRKSQ